LGNIVKQAFFCACFCFVTSRGGELYYGSLQAISINADGEREGERVLVMLVEVDLAGVVVIVKKERFLPGVTTC
jgi:hypothetical protein